MKRPSPSFSCHSPPGASGGRRSSHLQVGPEVGDVDGSEVGPRLGVFDGKVDGEQEGETIGICEGV